MATVKKGDQIFVNANSIFRMMGYEVVTGTVFLIYPDGHGFALKCEQTGAMETVNVGDGDVIVNE